MSGEKVLTSTMRCAYCGREFAWPDAFPFQTEAVCWRCKWNQHEAKEHPPKRYWRFRWPVYRDPAKKGSEGCPCGSGVAETDCHPGTKWADVMGTSHVETCGATYGSECDRCPTDKGSYVVGQGGDPQ